MNKKVLYTILLCAMAFAPLGNAAASEKERKGDRKRGEGQHHALIDACAGIAEGDACTFIGRDDQEVQGVCKAAREDVVACRAERGDRRKGRRGGMGGNRGVKASEEVTN